MSTTADKYPTKTEGHAEALWCHPDWRAVLQRAGLDSFEALMATGQGRSMTKRGLAAWRERIALEVEGHRLFLKRYALPAKPKCTLHPSRWAPPAEVERKALQAAAAAGVNVPDIVAAGAQGAPPDATRSLIVLAEAPGWSLEQWARDWPEQLQPSAKRRALSKALAETVARLHGAGLIHRDLYLAHIFARPSAAGRFELTLIDLARLHRPKVAKTRWIVKDLAGLHFSVPKSMASRADRVRWYKRYRNINRLTRRDRWLLRWIDWKARRIARHTAQHGLADKTTAGT